MYDAAMTAFISNDLVRVSKQSHLLYIAEEQGGRVNDVVGHLACFAGKFCLILIDLSSCRKFDYLY